MSCGSSWTETRVTVLRFDSQRGREYTLKNRVVSVQRRLRWRGFVSRLELAQAAATLGDPPVDRGVRDAEQRGNLVVAEPERLQ